jgi:hypothetical protein
MKTHAKLILLAACLMPALSLTAQTLISDLSSTTGWASSSQLVGTGASLTISGGSASLVTTSPGDSDLVVRGYTGVVGSYTSNWSVRLDVNYATPSTLFGSGVAQFINLGLLVAKTGVTPGVDGSNLPTFNGIEVASNLYQNGSNVRSADIRMSTFAPGSFTDDSNRYAQVSSVTTATATAVQISYNATTHVLTGSYDANGATGGYSFTSIPTLTADASTWSMTGSDTFSIYLLGNSGLDSGTGVGPTLGLGGATMDNLSGSGLTAVPEPSTYAAIAGLAALGLAFWRRRQNATAAA